MGKSALVKTFIEDVQHSMNKIMEVAFTTAREFDAQTPFFVWRRVFQHLLVGQNFDPDQHTYLHNDDENNAMGLMKENIINRLEMFVGIEDAQKFYPLVNPCLPFDFPETPATEILTGDGRISITRHFFKTIIENSPQVTGKALLLVVEDAHWCDILSWKLINDCCSFPKVSIIVTIRLNDKELTAEENVIKSSSRSFTSAKSVSTSDSKNRSYKNPPSPPMAMAAAQGRRGSLAAGLGLMNIR